MADDSRCIRLRGVRVHNLKGIDLDLPLNRLIVLTGVSGSGKSSLAFDTLYAEGQRRYIETFSAYTRQFLEKLDKPDADRIDGIPPAIAVAQRSGGRRSSRSTVGTVTEIQDYLGLLFARTGQVVCPVCGQVVEPANPATVARTIDALPEKTRYQIAFPMEIRPDSDREALAGILREDGFARVRVDGQIISLESGAFPMPADGSIDVVVDRLVRGSDSPERRLDSIETAFTKGQGRCRVLTESDTLTFYQGWRCGHCGIDYLEPDPRLFRSNSPLGACPTCEGFGRVIDLDMDRIVPDSSKTIRGGAIVPWTTPAYRSQLADLLDVAPALGIPTDVPFKHLTEAQQQTIVEGDPGHEFPGLRGFFRWLEKKSYKMHVRVFLSRWRGYSPCPACGGARLRPESLAVRVGEHNIAEVSALKISDVTHFLAGLAETERNPVVQRVVRQIRDRLDYLERIGLGYLTLDRQARTLSGGEAQRVTLTTALGSGLVNTLYVLDEPSIGLHPQDSDRLIAILRSLRDAGNSVVVVEHDQAIIRTADLLVDIGPGAGEAGGQLLYNGPPDGIVDTPQSATGDFLSGRRRILIPERRRPRDRGHLKLTGARGHNLKGIDVSFPLGVFCVVTGVSGSGKSTLVEETLYPALRRRLGNEALQAAPHSTLSGTNDINEVVLVDQLPIGRSGRSNPVTYLKAFDEIRKTFAATHDAKLRNYGAGQFSFNVEGGRCNSCEGNGFLAIDMQFLPDVMMRCPECRGTRYRPETLEITYRGRNIAEVLELTAREAFAFFRHRPKVQSRLRPLLDVGLDYLRLGQPATTLSGGEAQRLKLASYLATSPSAMTRSASRSKTLFVLDEPTTGLHPADTLKLLDALNSLLDLGQSLIVIEHSPDIMACADWIIDLGPGAGDEGGRIVAEGTPEEVARTDTATGRVLAHWLESKS
ncbi:excinuclease ABC subunit UvrA [Singulisphaera sp. Ch08]|uniref:UvrABC system protein A n=1 Tax=Singulisphaera sp. Ch08 TaxID=3120278 RepID=A0AAU7CPY5_9BACT